MAWRPGLIACIALALLAHALALGWLARHLADGPPLMPMVAPLYTRQITATTAPAPPRATPPVRRGKGSTVNAAAPVQPGTSTPPAATPTVVTTEADNMLPQDTPATPVTSAETPPVAPPTASPSPTPAPEPTSAPASVRWPPDTRLSYRLTGWFRGELTGDARVQWQQQGTRYQVRVDIDIGLLASLTLTSQGELGAEGLRPQAYEEIRRGKRRGVVLGTPEVTLADGRQVPRPDGLQDTASQFVDLSYRFAAGLAPLEVGQAVSFWMARPGALDLWTYDVIQRETLQTPRLGAVEAFHLKPRPIANPRGNITAEMWFAPSLQYLPVRIRINQGPEIWLDLLVDTIEQK